MALGELAADTSKADAALEAAGQEAHALLTSNGQMTPQDDDVLALLA
jgi:hypothetical protein